MVLLIIIPFLNGYLIGNIPNIFRQTHFKDHRLLQDPSHVLHRLLPGSSPLSQILKALNVRLISASLACPGWSWSSRSTSRAAGDSLATHRAPHPPCHPAEGLEPEELSAGWSHDAVGVLSRKQKKTTSEAERCQKRIMFFSCWMCILA